MLYLWFRQGNFFLASIPALRHGNKIRVTCIWALLAIGLSSREDPGFTVKVTGEPSFSWFLQSGNICKSSHSTQIPYSPFLLLYDLITSVSKKAYFNFAWNTHLQNHLLFTSILKSKIYLKTQWEKIYPAPLKIKFLPELDKFWHYQRCCCIRTEPNSSYIAPGIWSITNVRGSKNWMLGNRLSSHIDTPDTMKILQEFVRKGKRNEQAKSPVHIKKEIIQRYNLEFE